MPIESIIRDRHMNEVQKRKFDPKIETRVRREEFRKVEELAKEEGKSKSEVLREALLWYLDNREQLKNQDRETLTVKAINAMSNRLAAMIARLSRIDGTLFELTYASMNTTDEGKAAFEAALAKAKQKMANSLDQDERELAEKTKRIIKG